jgi:heme a synthase
VAALAVGIVSGGAVRLTGSGLGCSDWPACTSTSIVAPLQYHAWVEFGNRLINVLITLGAVATVVGVLHRRPRRTDLSLLAGGVVAGIVAEIVLGGETVLHQLAPPYVMGHFLLAIVLLADAAALYHRSRLPETRERTPPGRARAATARPLVRGGHLLAARTMLGWTFVVVTLGTVVTSTGPHAGAPGVPRFKFSLHTVAQWHGASVEVLLGLTVLTLVSLARARVPGPVLRRAEVLLVVLVAQAGVGYTQYLTGDPALLVAVHIAGATTVVLAMLAFNFGLFGRDLAATGTTVPVVREDAPALAPARI